MISSTALLVCCLFIALDYSASALQRKVTIWARVQVALGAKWVSSTPPVMPFFAAHSTAS